MVKIAIAGGSSQVAHEILDVLVATGKHEITLLSRKDFNAKDAVPDTKWVKIDYHDKSALTAALQGVHTVLSFADARHDEGGKSQKTLIDASIAAGVKRFAPAEWAVAETPATLADGKAPIRSYLAALNTPTKVLEYTLFQPGLFLNYLAAPYPAASHIRQLNTWFDFQSHRAIVLRGEEHSAKISFTTVQDLAGIMALAVDYEGEWPVIGGLRAGTVSAAELIALGEKIRPGPGPWEVITLERADVERGEIKSGWIPQLVHPSIPKELVEVFSKAYLKESLTVGMQGGYTVSDEWNVIFPGYEFTGIEAFLRGAWEGKP